MDWTTQPSQANSGFVWLNRNFLWCQAAPLMGFVFMNLAISSKSGTFCFDGSDKKMSDNGSDTGNFTRASWVRIKNLHYLFKTEMMGSKVPLAFKTGRVKNWNFSVSSRLDFKKTRWTFRGTRQPKGFYVSQTQIFTYIILNSYNKPGLHISRIVQAISYFL